MLPRLVGAPGALAVPTDGHWWDTANPFSQLGSAAEKVGADAMTNVMLAFWRCGLMVLRFALNLVDVFTTPDLSADGPGHQAYTYTFWMAGALATVLALVQVGVAAFRRDGKSLGMLLVGGAKFMVITAGWLTYGTALVAACGGLTRALMSGLMGVHGWAQWDPWGGFAADDVTDAGVATLLGILGVLLIIAALAHALVMLTRAGSLIVLAAITPVAAAGQLADLGQPWAWKSLRWFHAAAFTPVLMVLVIRIGTQVATTSAAEEAADSAGIPAQLGTALPAVMLILISCVAPLALFKLLAFTDPSTSSGSALRAGIEAQGGLRGVLSGGLPGRATSSGSGAASDTDESGRTQGEASAEDATTQRFAGQLGQVGQLAGKALGTMASIGSRGAALGSDLTNQMGVGHHSFQPDFTTARSAGGSAGDFSRDSSGGGVRNGLDPAGESNDDGRSNGPNSDSNEDPSGASSAAGQPTVPSPHGLPGVPSAARPPADSAPTPEPGSTIGGAGGESGGAGAAGVGGDAAAVAAL